MTKKITLVIVLLCCTPKIFGQKDSTLILKEVVVTANKRLHKNSKGYKIISLRDSIIVNNLASFTSLLRFNAPIYLREYGQGGTSSASFRGTSSSNTAVMWNGININSINNGQTGFNSFSVGLFDAIDIRSGGGSIEYGSGAIGGTIHLEDILEFSKAKQNKNQIVTSLGSFSTLNSIYKFKQTNKKHSFNFGMSFNSSENDYPIKNTAFKNTNGAYENYTLSFSNSYQFSKSFKLNFYTTYSFSDRFFSGELPNPTSANEKYQDINQRNLISLDYKRNKINFTTRVAYLFQKYKYFSNKDLQDFNFGSSDRYFADFTFNYNIFSKAVLSSRTKYESIFGRTDQISTRNRREFTQSLIFIHNPSNSFSYNLKVRKDYNSDFEVPTSVAVGFKIKPFDQFFLRGNASKNYRVPTYNDLYWPNQGNENLIPESSIQGELGLGYESKNLALDISYFTISSKDKIVWTPNGDPNRPGIWTPINLNKTNNSGIEVSAKYRKHLFSKVQLNTTLNYGYTLAKNTELDKFLPFIPKHLFNGNISVSIKKTAIFFQQLFNGETFTTESNSVDYIVESFLVSNMGANYRLISNSTHNLILGFKLNNIFDKYYQVIQNRPMPGFNFNFNINYKF